MSNSKSPSTIEQTEVGLQFVIDGYRLVSLKERLEAIGNQPKRFRRADRPCLQKPCDIGLFDEVSRNQMDLF
ncbi:hypothetical protein ACFQ14_12560 [Pseudahrensia aquimaris]|uniref:Uncharacterized protein n=1 Tax=Pseudahrensia aquimaris TaxID=744461 RepID=A0ABW3FFI9_9HYPH